MLKTHRKVVTGPNAKANLPTLTHPLSQYGTLWPVCERVVKPRTEELKTADLLGASYRDKGGLGLRSSTCEMRGGGYQS